MTFGICLAAPPWRSCDSWDWFPDRELQLHISTRPKPACHRSQLGGGGGSLNVRPRRKSLPVFFNLIREGQPNQEKLRAFLGCYRKGTFIFNRREARLLPKLGLYGASTEGWGAQTLVLHSWSLGNSDNQICRGDKVLRADCDSDCNGPCIDGAGFWILFWI